MGWSACRDLPPRVLYEMRVDIVVASACADGGGCTLPSDKGRGKHRRSEMDFFKIFLDATAALSCRALFALASSGTQAHMYMHNPPPFTTKRLTIQGDDIALRRFSCYANASNNAISPSLDCIIRRICIAREAPQCNVIPLNGEPLRCEGRRVVRIHVCLCA